MLSRIFRIPDPKPTVSSREEFQHVLTTFLDRNATRTEPQKMILVGPHGCGKTSLLFSLAMTFSEEGKNVLFICPKKVSTLPILPEGEQKPSTSILRKIHMVYLETREEFLKYMASIHCNLDVVFHCLIVDGLDSYVTGAAKNEDLTVMARLLAFTVDAFNFELEKLKKEDAIMTNSMLVISITIETSTIPIPRQNLYERWIDYILRIKSRKDFRSGERQFELSVLPPQCKQGESNTLIDVNYLLTDTHFSVSEISA
ncbi:uncharacterized protein LOC116290135 [Actinia tenebrosa]|uniref:Uncharacterized protein LOC116290135 n=1 Tax=Actinia tenebrosa TaxID=6105 RepID=A0A6P8HK69_ACTTE|nr:uncharacterized protein LOC116290135 [Actinia tenebrosa]